MSAGVANLLIQQGETFSRLITIEDSLGVPINLTGYTARAQIRLTAQSTTIAASFLCTFDADRSTGKITISLTDTQTSAITATGDTYSVLSTYTWDLEIIVGSTVTRLLNGTVTVSPEVTRS